MIASTRETRHRTLLAAAYGSAGWAAYATIEMAVASILPFFVLPRSSYFPVHPGTSTLLLTLYTLFGSTVGLATAVMIPRRMSEERHREAATAIVRLSIILAVCALLFRQLRGWSLVAESLIAVTLLLFVGI